MCERERIKREAEEGRESEKEKSWLTFVPRVICARIYGSMFGGGGMNFWTSLKHEFSDFPKTRLGLIPAARAGAHSGARTTVYDAVQGYQTKWCFRFDTPEDADFVYVLSSYMCRVRTCAEFVYVQSSYMCRVHSI